MILDRVFMVSVQDLPNYQLNYRWMTEGPKIPATTGHWTPKKPAPKSVPQRDGLGKYARELEKRLK